MLCPWAESSGRLLCILLAPTKGAINRALTRVLPDREIGRQSKGGKAGGAGRLQPGIYTFSLGRSVAVALLSWFRGRPEPIPGGRLPPQLSEVTEAMAVPALPR
jgi:hypothetical protein